MKKDDSPKQLDNNNIIFELTWLIYSDENKARTCLKYTHNNTQSTGAKRAQGNKINQNRTQASNTLSAQNYPSK